jgi:hypothetical protein
MIRSPPGRCSRRDLYVLTDRYFSTRCVMSTPQLDLIAVHDGSICADELIRPATAAADISWQAEAAIPSGLRSDMSGQAANDHSGVVTANDLHVWRPRGVVPLRRPRAHAKNPIKQEIGRQLGVERTTLATTVDDTD